MEALSPERDALWARLEKTSFLTDVEKRALIGYGPKGSPIEETAIEDQLKRGEVGPRPARPFVPSILQIKPASPPAKPVAAAGPATRAARR